MPPLKDSLKETIPIVAERFGRECSDEEITRLTDLAKGEGCDVIVGIGGGVSDDDLMKVANIACGAKETIHNEPVLVTPAKVIASLKAAAAEGIRQKSIV